MDLIDLGIPHGREANKTFDFIEVPEYSFVQKKVKEMKLPDKPSYSASLNNKFSLTDVKWDYFNIKDLFNVSASKDKVLLDYSSEKPLC